MEKDFKTKKIFGKLLKPKEVAIMTNLPLSTIRYWEDEFNDFFKPFRTKGNQRRYYEKDVQTLLYIKYLLDVEQYTIEGAKKKLKKFNKINNLNFNEKLNYFVEKFNLQEKFSDIQKLIYSMFSEIIPAA